MKRASSLLSAALLCSLIAAAAAQDYRFEVNRNVSWLVIDSAGQADLHYRLTFTCAPGAHDIDIVDIGMPNGSYDLGSAQASVGGEQLPGISVSEYVKPHGVEVHLGRRSIRPGDSATLFFSIHLAQMLNEDGKDKTYASFQFSPTWYGSQYVSGRTYLECNFVFPPGTAQDEPRYHQREFTESWYDSSARAPVYRWALADAAPDEQYTFGASFPAGHVAAGAIRRAPGLGMRILGGIFAVIGALFTFLLSTAFFWIFGLIFFFAWRQNKVRRMKYLPPQLSVEGVGIKRGLTAPEAALLLELPLDKVLAMVLFGLAKKGAIEVVAREPEVRLKVLAAARADQDYERAFVAAIGDKGAPVPDQLRKMAVDFIKSTNTKLKGFSRKETAAYYRQIVSQAWEMVKAAETPELKVKALEDNNDWMMMDPGYSDRMRSSYGAGYFPLPRWWGPLGYGGGASTAGQASPPSGGNGKVQMPKLPGADFANNIVSGAEKFAAGLVGGKLADFTGKVTSVTNPVPVSSSSGSSGGGRSSCACACACAGCACACAGGGR